MQQITGVRSDLQHNSAFSFSGKLACCAALCWAGMVAPAAAQSMDQNWGVYVQGGQTTHSNDNTQDATLGFVAPLMSGRDWWGGKLSAYWDVFASDWRAPAVGGGHSNYTQLGVVPTLRYRLDGGQSAWFAEAGLGLAYLDGTYTTPDRTFSTRLNFSEILGVGLSFGAQGQYELGLRLQHFSNAGIKEPNPGETFGQLRFTLRF